MAEPLAAGFVAHYLDTIGLRTPAAAAFATSAPETSPRFLSTDEPDNADVVTGGVSSAVTTTYQRPPLSSWPELIEQAAACTACPLHAGRRQVVVGRGNPQAKLLLIGEAPGEEEDKQGLPFVGRSGQLLDRMIAACNLGPEQVYIMNVIKCRPPGNRNPHHDELTACARWFDAQMALLSPAVVVLLGRVAAHHLLHCETSISQLRGCWQQWRNLPLRVTFHPSYLLRSPEQKSLAWQDWRAIMRQLASQPPA